MANTWEEVCNKALILLGTRVIQSLNDPTPQARLCKQVQPEAARMVYRMHPWNSCMKRVNLTPTTTTPAFGYTYSFALPADCLRVDSVNNKPDYRREGKFLLSNNSTLSLRYIAEIIDPSQLDSMLTDAIAHYIAYSMAYDVTQSDTARQTMYKGFQESLKQAKSADSKENPAQVLDAEYLLSARFNGPASDDRRYNNIDTGGITQPY